MGSDEFRDRVAVLARDVGEDALADAAPGAHPRRPRVAGGRPGQRHRASATAACWWRALPARVRAGRPAVGAHRHRGPGVPHRRAVRLHDEGRHRRAGAHAGRGAARTSPRTAERGASGSSGAQVAAALARRAGSAGGRRGRASAAGSRRSARRRPASACDRASFRAASGPADPAPGPLAVRRDEQIVWLRDRRPRLDERLDALVRGRPRAQVRLVVRGRTAQRPCPVAPAQPRPQSHAASFIRAGDAVGNNVRDAGFLPVRPCARRMSRK